MAPDFPERCDDNASSFCPDDDQDAALSRSVWDDLRAARSSEAATTRWVDVDASALDHVQQVGLAAERERLTELAERAISDPERLRKF
jgi:hypothetical protein